MFDHSTHWVLFAEDVKAGSPVPLTVTSACAVPPGASSATVTMAIPASLHPCMPHTVRQAASAVIGRAAHPASYERMSLDSRAGLS